MPPFDKSDMFSCAVKPVTLLLTSVDRIMQTGSRNSTQTGSNNNVTTETDIDTISTAMPIFSSFWAGGGSLVCMPSSADASFTQKF